MRVSASAKRRIERHPGVRWCGRTPSCPLREHARECSKPTAWSRRRAWPAKGPVDPCGAIDPHDQRYADTAPPPETNQTTVITFAPRTDAISNDLHQRAETSPQPPVVAPPTETTGDTPSPHTRTGAAWFGICLAALALVVLIVFMLHNTGTVEVTFLSMHGSLPLASISTVCAANVSTSTGRPFRHAKERDVVRAQALCPADFGRPGRVRR